MQLCAYIRYIVHLKSETPTTKGVGDAAPLCSVAARWQNRCELLLRSLEWIFHLHAETRLVSLDYLNYLGLLSD